MAMIVSDAGIAITKRFFEAIDILVETRYFRGLQTFTSKYGLNRRNVLHIKAHPENSVLKPEVLALLVKYHDVSAEWLLTGEGSIFKGGYDKPEPVVWRNKPRVQKTIS